MSTKSKRTSVEICAGAGGQALGLEEAGFEHLACVEIDRAACATLRTNRPNWNVVETDVRSWFPEDSLQDVDLLAGGVPCPPFSIAGKQQGKEDERDLFPEMIRLAKELNPKAIMIENVRGLLSDKFKTYRTEILREFERMGYIACGWNLLNAADFGVPQTRYRAILVLMKMPYAMYYSWPEPNESTRTVGEALYPFMLENGWEGAGDWAERAAGLAPTLVGGSKKHGGADLGPTRAKNGWLELGVDGKGLADSSPAEDFAGIPRLTVAMAAAIQGFPKTWTFEGKKTPAYRQVGNAFPPPVARSVGVEILRALELGASEMS